MKGLRAAVLLGVVGGVGCVLIAGPLARASGRGDAPAQQAADAAATTAAATIASLRRGEVVHLSGEVIRVVDRDEFRIADGTGSVPVRISWTGASPVSVGDRVQVEGVVVDEMTFGLSRPEVIARALSLPGGATVRFDAPQTTQPAAETAPATQSTPAQAAPSQAATAPVTPIGRLTRGQSATIAGRVTGILDTDEFRVEDASGSVRVYVGWQNRVGVRVGDAVTISGMLDDEPWPLPAEFYADSVMLADGSAVDVRAGATGGGAGGVAGGGQTAAPSSGATPLAPSRIADVRPYDTVLLRGTVERITDEDEFRLRDDSGSIGVYIGWRNAMPVSAGEQVSLVGIVDAEGPAGLLREVYAHEITTADGRRVELQPRRDAGQPSATTTTTTTDRAASDQPAARGSAAGSDVAVITPIRDVRRGQAVTLSGEVQRLRDTDEFVLRDDTGTITVYIGWRNRMPVSAGQRVTVVGTADDDVFPGMRPEVYASAIVLPDGQRIELIRGRDE